MIDQAYISIGANRSSSCAAAFDDGLLAYGAGNTVALWDMNGNGRGVCATLIGHKAHVTTLKRIDSATFVSGDQAGEVRVWSREGRTFLSNATFTAHKGSSISALAVTPDGKEVLTGGSDGLVRRWKLGEKVEEVEKLELKGKLPLDLSVGTLPGSTVPVLIMGLTDRKVQVWTLVNGSYHYALSLEGHEDWVRCLALTPYPGSSGGGSDLLLATGAQDNYIRLWRISPWSGGGDMFEDLAQRLDGSAQISTKAHVLAVEDGAEKRRFNITLEALLVGHECGLTNVNWSSAESPRLLSSASDNSLVIWSPTEGEHGKDGMWVPEHRFGAFGGRGLAFFGAVWAPRDEAVIATGWTGGVERWVRNGESWETSPGVSGHFGTVQSVAWDPAGDYLLSTGSDQTSRIHAPCRPTAESAPVWAEIARPQIHGYDMVDGAFLSSFRIASAGEEKVTRVFEATTGFAESLSTLGVCSKPASEISHLPRGATVPPLGLSNRALGKAEAATDIPKKLVPKEHVERDLISSAMTSLPTEEELSTSTLWPEIEKIYGHGYELATLATSHTGDLIATACRASSAEHAVVRIVSAKTWGDLATLPGHSLTVTRIAFRPDDSMVLTVSRDRGWRLFGRDGDDWTPLASEEKAHARMVLDCAWAGNDTFVTASRDKTIKVWCAAGKAWTCAATFKLTEAATAVAVTQREEGHLMAVGTESGSIELFTLAGEVTPFASVPATAAHNGTVTRLAFRPDGVTLASAGEDRAVRVFTISS